MTKLGVNIDHVATVRQARRTYEPDPVWAAMAAELGGADCITLHLREDRRHIQDRDVRVARETVTVKFNLEMACTPEIVRLAREIQPDQCTLVPERREEVTTEGGLDVIGQFAMVQNVTRQLQDAGIIVSLFLDPIAAQIEAAKQLGADGVELHTGQYALAKHRQHEAEKKRLCDGAALVRQHGLDLHAGHGLTYQNVHPIAAIPEMGELNIGHSIVARAIFVGMTAAVAEMKRLIENSRSTTAD